MRTVTCAHTRRGTKQETHNCFIRDASPLHPTGAISGGQNTPPPTSNFALGFLLKLKPCFGLSHFTIGIMVIIIHHFMSTGAVPPKLGALVNKVGIVK